MISKHKIPEWVTRGKKISELIKELQAFEDQDMEVRISIDYGDTDHAISIVTGREGKYCVLESAEPYYRGEWQQSKDSASDDV